LRSGTDLLIVGIWLAATYAQTGQSERADREAAEVMRIEPGFTIDGTARRICLFKNPSDADHFFDGLSKAGLRAK
jgi:adenylate cyclase